MSEGIFYLKNYHNEPEIHDAFRKYIYEHTNWKIVYYDDDYYGKTKERYELFRAGYISAKNNGEN